MEWEAVLLARLEVVIWGAVVEEGETMVAVEEEETMVAVEEETMVVIVAGEAVVIAVVVEVVMEEAEEEAAVVNKQCRYCQIYLISILMYSEVLVCRLDYL